MIKIVNVIPQSLSGETNQDSEPNIAVNPANPQQIAITAFTPDPMSGPNAPIFVSADGGDHWTLNSIVPSAGSIGTGDITTKFAGTSNRFFATILDGATGAFEVHRTNNFNNPAAMSQLESRTNEDQPYIQAATVMGGAGVGTDRVYIGVNDFNASGGKTATVEETLDGGAASPSFSSVRLEKRSTLGQNGPQVRPAIHPDGTIYAAFYRWISSSGSFPGNTLVITNAELIVVRDDNWGTGATPFTALVDSSDSLSGRRVATGLSFPFNQTGVNANGQERWGGDISTAVDPRNSSTLYVAFSTLVSNVYTLQVMRSLDRGVTWSGVLLSVSTAKNPAIAINSLGKIALVYQQITGSGATQRWETHFRDSTNGTTWSDTILCMALSQSPTRQFSPYIGDYLHMMAVGKDFYGVFSASNVADTANFPSGITYQRNHDFVAKKLFALDGVTQINPSIDPFFFKVTQIDPGTHSDFYLRDWTNTASDHDTGLEPSTNSVFYASSDVWNQRSNVAPTFINDQPQNEDPQNNATNFAFARISRNDSASAETVSVDFLVAEFGTGSPFQLVVSVSVSFAAGDTSKIATASWNLNPTSSTHLCLAAQISTPSDPFVLPGLNGNTPGWPTTDLIVINDNNKAQRNMSVHYGLSASASASAHFAIVRNASKLVRDFILVLKADPESLKAFVKPSVQVEGGEPIAFQSGVSMVLKGMKPGESRWVAFDMKSFRVTQGQSIAVDMLESIQDKLVNGYRVNITGATTAKAIREQLFRMAGVFQRLIVFKMAGADKVLAASTRLLKTTSLTAASYVSLLNSIRDPMAQAVKQFVSTPSNDRSLNIAAGLVAVLKAVDAKNFEAAFATLTTLLNKVDVALTLTQKQQSKAVASARSGRRSKAKATSRKRSRR